MAASVVMAGILSAVDLSIGIMGYHCIAGFDWVDSLLEAAMILGGMGPVKPLATTGAKMFLIGKDLQLSSNAVIAAGITGIQATRM